MEAGGEWKNDVSFLVNGERKRVSAFSPKLTLLDFLRENEQLFGTKISCNQGGCGACTVMVSRSIEGDVVHSSVNACLTLVASLDGCHVTTVEGLGSTSDGMHPVQQRMAANNASQCGYCTPGMCMSLYSLLKSKKGQVTQQEVEEQLTGNLCRCTGYKPIVEAGQSFAGDAPEALKEQVGDGKKFVPYDPEQHDPKIPEEELREARPAPFRTEGDGITYYRVTQLSQVLDIRKKHAQQKLKLVVGNTSRGVFGYTWESQFQVFVDVSGVAELLEVSEDDSSLTVGAARTISNLSDMLWERREKSPGSFERIVSHIAKVAGPNVRNWGSWAGNVMMARDHGFASDVATLLFGAGCTIHYLDLNGDKKESTMEAFFSNKDFAIVTALTVPYTKPNEHFFSFRSAMRPVNSHALANAAFRVTLDGSSIAEATVVYGAIQAKPVVVHEVEEWLKGSTFSADALQQALVLVRQHVEVEEEAIYKTIYRPEGKQAYREALLRGFFYRFYVGAMEAAGLEIRPDVVSAAAEIVRAPQTSKHVYQENEGKQGVPKISGPIQTTGEATYSLDVPDQRDTLYGALVLTNRAAVYLKSVDPSDALAVEGVVAFLGAEDIPGENSTGMGDEIFASERVTFTGQPVGMVVAKTRAAAATAARFVRIEYGEEYETPIFSLEDAVKNNSHLNNISNTIKCGDLEEGFGKAARVVEGRVHFGGQQHFYMEKQSAYARTLEGDVVEVHVGNQGADHTRAQVAAVIGRDSNKVRIRCARTGGGFGGKLTKQLFVAGPAAVAAIKLKRSIKVLNSIQDDHALVGGRHAGFADYKVGFDEDGTIVALQMNSALNGGCSADFSAALCGEYNEALDSVYHIPHYEAVAKIYRTHLPARTAVRAFGHPQAVIVTESIVERVANELGLTAEKVREKNLYTSRNAVTPGGLFLESWDPRVYNEMKDSSEFEKRFAAIRAFNNAHVWRKRGISLIPIKYGATQSYAKGTTAQVNINGADGSVTVHTSLSEIGQGADTKLAQAVAMTLGCPLSVVRVAGTDTDTLPNGGWTGGSVGSEAAMEAGRLACIKLNKRLRYVKEKMREMGAQEIEWSDLIENAGDYDVLLSAQGAFVPVGREHSERSNLPWAKGSCDYYSYASTVAEVEIDVLTGESVIRRLDMLYDSAQSMNPIIDIGQIEGCWAYAVGYFLREEMLITADGINQSCDTWEYKPPSVKDVPIDGRVELMANSFFPRGVFGQKAVGEPPLVAAYAVAGAIKHAINEARSSRGLDAKSDIPLPLTVDVIQSSCEVNDSHLKL